MKQLDLEHLQAVTGAVDHAQLYQGQLCSEAAWRDRRANYDRWGSTIAAEDYCNAREPNSWAARVNKGLATEQYGSVSKLAASPWHQFVNGHGPMPRR